MQGILMPVPTIFRADGDVDAKGTLDIIDDLIDVGVHALFILGSAGQGPAMELDERAELADAVIKHVRGRLPVLVNVGTSYLRSSLWLTERAVASGADAILSTPPFYYSDHPAAEVDAHLVSVAEASGGRPFVIYNNERYTGINITPPWLARLAARIPNLRGIKLSYTPQAGIFRYVEQAPDHVNIYTASTLEMLPTVPFGTRGCINPPSIAFPDLAVAMWDALIEKNYARAFELQASVKEVGMSLLALEGKYGRFIVAEAMRARGYKVDLYPRWAEGEPIDDVARAEVRRVIAIAKAAVAPPKALAGE
jgi:dihydrodipicolinate synthase/N-acetylneuraminate lyase